MYRKSILLMAYVMVAIGSYGQIGGRGALSRSQVSAAQAAATTAAKATHTPIGAATRTCFATFNTALPNFCVTQNGNIENFMFPAGFSQLFTDGYGICDLTSGNAYFDTGDVESGNWQNPVIVEPGGANTFPLTITRSTADGIWTIKQAFSRSTADAYVKVVMTFINNSAALRAAVFDRYDDIDADGSDTDDWFDGDANSGWGHQPASPGTTHGLTVRSNQSKNNYLGFATDYTPSGQDQNPCTFIGNAEPKQGDQAVMYIWVPGGGSFNVPAHGTVTQTIELRPM